MPVALAPFLCALGAVGFAGGSVQAWSHKMFFCVTAIAPWPSLWAIPRLWSRACFASFLLLLFLCLQCDQPAVWRAGTLSSAKTSFWLTRGLACRAGALSACVGHGWLCVWLRASLVTQHVGRTRPSVCIHACQVTQNCLKVVLCIYQRMLFVYHRSHAEPFGSVDQFHDVERPRVAAILARVKKKVSC